jgi:hypothetical protein
MAGLPCNYPSGNIELPQRQGNTYASLDHRSNKLSSKVKWLDSEIYARKLWMFSENQDVLVCVHMVR